MTVQVDVWLRGHDFATTDAIEGIEREPHAWTDYFFPNNDEAAQLLGGETDPVVQSHRIRDDGARNVVITCGSQGAILVTPSIRLKSAVYPVEPVDATGTGDAFVSGFVLGLLTQSSPERCLELGTAMGASCVRCMGATTGVFDAHELRQFVDSHSLRVESW